MKRTILTLVGIACAVTLLSQPALANDRFTYSSNGSEVTDTTTGLTWKRCSEGQQFSYDRCVGKATEHNFKGALTHAKSNATPEVTWRVPNINELSTLVNKNVRRPAIDANVFPDTAANRYWSSSPHETDVTQGIIVYFSDGHIVKYHQNNKAHVRLVR